MPAALAVIAMGPLLASGIAEAPAELAGTAIFEELPFADGAYSVSLALWTEADGGELVGQVELGERRIRAGTLLLTVGGFRAPEDHSEGLWLEVTVDGAVAAPRQPFPGGAHGGSNIFVDGNVRTLRLIEPNAELFPQLSDTHFWSTRPGGEVWVATRTAGGDVFFRIIISAEGVVSLLGGSDANLGDGSGFVVLGSEGGENLVLDSNEIMARNDGAMSTLFLQQDGGAVYVNGVVAHASDLRLKREIRDLDLGLAEVLALRPVSFSWRSGDGRRHRGLIAQEVQAVSPDLVMEDDGGHLGVVYSDLVPVLIRALQQQNERLARMEAELEALREAAED